MASSVYFTIPIEYFEKYSRMYFVIINVVRYLLLFESDKIWNVFEMWSS